MDIGSRLLSQERNKQIAKYGIEQDKQYTQGELVLCALWLAFETTDKTGYLEISLNPTISKWVDKLIEKHKDDKKKLLSIAGALIAAELTRISGE